MNDSAVPARTHQQHLEQARAQVIELLSRQAVERRLVSRAAAVGVGAPVMLQRFGRDPVMGSSIILTASTDCLGFFYFLGLAAVFLV